MKKIALWAMCIAVMVLSGCRKAPEWKAEHVFVIGLDGWGAYSVEKADMPNVKALMDAGCYTLKKRSVLPSSSAVNWASMFMGAGPELPRVHGVGIKNARTTLACAERAWHFPHRVQRVAQGGSRCRDGRTV